MTARPVDIRDSDPTVAMKKKSSVGNSLSGYVSADWFTKYITEVHSYLFLLTDVRRMKFTISSNYYYACRITDTYSRYLTVL